MARAPQLLVAWLSLGSLAATACSASVASPSGFEEPAGATISGTVVGPTSSSIAAIAPPPSRVANSVPFDLTVSVVGTSIAGPVDGSGRFDLHNVPAGTVALKFSGPGVNAVAVLAGVGGHQLVEVHITITGPSAVVEADVRSSGHVALCHSTGNGRYQPLEVNVSAKPMHQAHGDGEVGDEVPGAPGAVFGPACAATTI